ncbi:unnamed protein product [Schistosoma turkestanicum]|nr:unnamed protein product [Schistosoma turkestanicum]
MLDKLTHFKNLLSTDEKRSSDIMDLSSKISSKTDSWNFDNLFTLNLHNQSDYHHASVSFLHNHHDPTNANENSQLLSSSSAKSLAYCTPNPVPNLPENNQVHFLEYRGAHLATFTVNGRDLICLPQAFELFLKHLVGGLHTVYTKLKRLDIIPVVCNVEQVRILRGLGAIQPGVNRCKLIGPQEFDILYADCTNSRPGRPSKRLAAIETPVLSSALRSRQSTTCYNNDSGESTPKQSRNSTSEDENSGNNQSQSEQTIWPNSQSNISAYSLMNSSKFVLPLLMKENVFGHLETVYSSFMKYALSNYQNRLEHEQNSCESTNLKSVYDSVEKNVAVSSSDVPQVFSDNIMTHSDRHSTENLLDEDTVSSPTEPKTMENSNQLSNYQQLFDSKLQYFLNQFIGMNSHWKSVHHSVDTFESTMNALNAQIKIKSTEQFDQHLHHSNCSFNMNQSESLKCDKSSQPFQTLYPDDSFKEKVPNVKPSTSINDCYNNDEESFHESSHPHIFNSLGYLKNLKLNKPACLNFSVEQIKMDSKSATMSESNENEDDKEEEQIDTPQRHSTDYKRKEIALTRNNDNCNDLHDDQHDDSDEDYICNNHCDNDEVTKISHNKDMSKMITILNYYYWWLQYMSNEFSREKQSVINESKESVFNNFPSFGCYTNLFPNCKPHYAINKYTNQSIARPT